MRNERKSGGVGGVGEGGEGPFIQARQEHFLQTGARLKQWPKIACSWLMGVFPNKMFEANQTCLRLPPAQRFLQTGVYIWDPQKNNTSDCSRAMVFKHVTIDEIDVLMVMVQLTHWDKPKTTFQTAQDSGFQTLHYWWKRFPYGTFETSRRWNFRLPPGQGRR